MILHFWTSPFQTPPLTFELVNMASFVIRDLSKTSLICSTVLDCNHVPSALLRSEVAGWTEHGGRQAGRQAVRQAGRQAGRQAVKVTDVCEICDVNSLPRLIPPVRTNEQILLDGEGRLVRGRPESTGRGRRGGMCRPGHCRLRRCCVLGHVCTVCLRFQAILHPIPYSYASQIYRYKPESWVS